MIETMVVWLKDGGRELGEGGVERASPCFADPKWSSPEHRHHPSFHPDTRNRTKTLVASTQDTQIPSQQLAHISQTHNGLTRNVDAGPPPGRQLLLSRNHPSQLPELSTHARSAGRSYACPQACRCLPWRVRNIPIVLSHLLPAPRCTAKDRRVT